MPFVVANGGRLHYRVWGERTAPPLLLIHGYPGHTHIWDAFAQALCDDHWVIAIDLRGHGESDWADSYSVVNWADDVYQLAIALALPRFTLLGFSLGSTIGFCFAQKHHDRLHRLVALDGLPLGAWEPTTPNPGLLPDSFATHTDAVAFFGEIGTERAEDAVAENLKLSSTGRYVWRHDLAVREAILRELQYDDDWRNRAALTKVPIVYLRCGRTHVGSRAETAAILQVFPDCQLIDIADAPHSLPRHDPELLSATVRTFL